MRIARLCAILFVVGVIVSGLASTSRAAGPRNPYSSFNLSGINYGAQQWDRDQRAGRSVWPYYNTPSRSYYRGSNVSVGGGAGGGMGGAVIQGGTYRSSPRTVRRWRR